jgi:transmembrane sensor
MTGQSAHIAKLLARKVHGDLTPEEERELDTWRLSSDINVKTYENIIEGSQLTNLLNQYESFSRRRIATELQKEFSGITLDSPVNKYYPAVHRVHFLKTAWFRYAAAIVVLFGIGAYLWITELTEKRTIVVNKPSVSNDILPGSDKAVLTLSNGRQIGLDKIEEKTIQEGELNIQNANGELTYSPSAKMVFNTMTTPAGGQYKLTLADGTRVWLNAASSITFPTAFNGKNREVNITGEAYFEVAVNERMPFKVKVNDELSVDVLGTTFNINAYPDEPATKTILIEGSVKVNAKSKSVILQPLDLAIIEDKITVKNNANTAQAIAWKNGVFNFENAPFDEFARQLARWYDIKIMYEGRIPQEKFIGDLGRNLTLSQVLKVLSAYDIKYELNNKTLIIKN